MVDRKYIKIAPSIFASDYGRLADEARRVTDAGADSIHIDVMDGHFVRNLSFGPGVVAAINRATDVFLDVHLMIYNPFEYIERFAEAGADSITIHFEATEHVEDTLNYIRKCNVKAGLAFCPETSMSLIPKYLDKCDMILLMTVHPGFGGQPFLNEVLDKVKFTRDLCDQLHVRAGGVTAKSAAEAAQLSPFDIQVDGGITQETASLSIEAGANVLVAGVHIFQHAHLAKAIKDLRDA
jgi:ribulose-phosphate 3-epimerase